MKTAIVIVNYKTAGLVADCLDSLAATCAPMPPQTVVVDNASPDDSTSTLHRHVAERGYETWCSVIAAERNGGFAYGNNVGLRALLGDARGREAEDRPDAVLLLNPDTIVREGSIAELLRFLGEHPEASIVGSRLEHPGGTAQRSAFRFHSLLGEFEAAVRWGVLTRLLSAWVVAPAVRDEAGPCDWVSGASLMVRTRVFDDIGLLDDGYFMYYEETDFCLRARRAGHRCWYVPSSRVVPLVGQASGIVHGRPRRRPAYWFDARRRYFIKNHGRAIAMLADLAWFIGAPVERVKRAITRRGTANPERFLHDLLRYGAIRNGLDRRDSTTAPRSVSATATDGRRASESTAKRTPGEAASGADDRSPNGAPA